MPVTLSSVFMAANYQYAARPGRPTRRLSFSAKKLGERNTLILDLRNSVRIMGVPGSEELVARLKRVGVLELRVNNPTRRGLKRIFRRLLYVDRKELIQRLEREGIRVEVKPETMKPYDFSGLNFPLTVFFYYQQGKESGAVPCGLAVVRNGLELEMQVAGRIFCGTGKPTPRNQTAFFKLGNEPGTEELTSLDGFLPEQA